MPIKKLDKDSVTFATVVCRSFAMSGKPGRYMSMEKGPMAESTPRMRIIKKCPENGVSENITRFPERSNVCPSDNEPVVRSELFFGAVIRKGEVTQMDTILIIGAGAAGL